MQYNNAPDFFKKGISRRSGSMWVIVLLLFLY